LLSRCKNRWHWAAKQVQSGGFHDFSRAGSFMNIKDHIRGVPDYPKPGILFYDISTLLAHAGAWRETVRQLTDAVTPLKPDLLIGIESRGFLVAAPLALALGCGFVMVRKRGKLPGPTISYTYDLEYGSDTIEIQADAVKPGQRVVVLDDLLATGGTLAAAIALARQVGADVVGAACIIELSFLEGRQRIGVPLHSVVDYDS
jgi:adenine phosphoribosyltransferase